MAYGNGKAEFEVIEAAENAERTGRRQIWERLDGESAKAYCAFVKYRDLAERRTLAKVAQMSDCSSQNIERWSRRWCWGNRVAAFDLIEEEKQREQLCRDRMSMRRRQIQIGMALQNVAAHGLREWQAKIASGTPLNMTANEIATMMELGARLEREAMGEEKDHRYTRINVIIGDHKYEGEEKDAPEDPESVN